MSTYKILFIDENGAELQVTVQHPDIVSAMAQVVKMVEGRQKSDLPNFIGVELSVVCKTVMLQ